MQDADAGAHHLRRQGGYRAGTRESGAPRQHVGEKISNVAVRVGAKPCPRLTRSSLITRVS